jgi:hypothetical protein
MEALRGSREGNEATFNGETTFVARCRCSTAYHGSRRSVDMRRPDWAVSTGCRVRQCP